MEDSKLQALKKQIEFYFSDSNWVRDKWLKDEAAKNPEQYINAELFQQFPKIKNMNVTTEQITQVASSSQHLTLSTDGKMIKRKNPPPTEESILQKSVYLTGMPENITQEEVTSSISAHQVTAVCVWLRKTPTGSAFVELASPDQVEKLIKIGETQGLIIKGKSVRVQRRQIYTGEQRKDKRKRNDDSNSNSDPQVVMKDRVTTPDTGADLPNLKKGEYPKGVVAIIQQVSVVAREEDVKALMGFYGKVNHVTVEKEGKSLVRYENASDAQKAVEDIKKNRASKILYGKQLDVDLLSGEQEEKYWNTVVEAKESKQMQETDPKKAKTN